MRDRDQRCVGTGDDDELCDAAHIIPHSKGNEVRQISSPYCYWGLIFLSSIFHVSLLKEVDLPMDRLWTQ